MSKSMVVISGIVDVTIREYQKDVNFYMFKTIEELDKFIEHTPIRAETLFFSKDVIPLVNTSLNYIVSLMEKVFFRVDNVVYITEPDSRELESVRFLIKSKNYTNWEIIEGPLTREYVTGVVNGSARSDAASMKHKAVYRIPKDTYVKQKVKHMELLSEEPYQDDDTQMQEMPDEKLPVYVPTEQDQTCTTYDIVGDNIVERTLLVFIMGQYLATHGRTLLLERDCEYHLLGEFVTKSGADCDIFYVEDLLLHPEQTIDDIAHCRKNLVVCMCKKRIRYNYSFIFNLLYNNLIENMMYAVREDYYGEEPTESKYTVVFPNTVYGVLSMCDKTNINFLDYTKFVAIHMGTLNEVRLPTKEAVSAIIEDVLNTKKIEPVVLLSLTSTVMGNQDNYDLRSILWK